MEMVSKPSGGEVLVTWCSLQAIWISDPSQLLLIQMFWNADTPLDAHSSFCYLKYDLFEMPSHSCLWKIYIPLPIWLLKLCVSELYILATNLPSPWLVLQIKLQSWLFLELSSSRDLHRHFKPVLLMEPLWSQCTASQGLFTAYMQSGPVSI